jgi:DNA mismatch repair ATPase MutS
MDDRVFTARGFYNVVMAVRMRDMEGGRALAGQVVTNDVALEPGAGIFILTGPNRGGKTTFTQGIGLAQVLAQSGLCVPAAEAVVSPVDLVLTHFPREESAEMGAGRLGEEATRLASIFGAITRHSLVLLNESLSSTSPGESLYLAEDIIRAFRLLGCRAVFATHLHELAARAQLINEEIEGESSVLSVVAGSEPHNGEVKRTYRIQPGPPVGRSFARDIADRHGISFEKLLQTLRGRKLV